MLRGGVRAVCGRGVPVGCMPSGRGVRLEAVAFHGSANVGGTQRPHCGAVRVDE